MPSHLPASLKNPILRELAEQILASPLDQIELGHLLSVVRESNDPTLEPRDGYAATDLAHVGWGVVFADGVSPEIREAVEPLVAHRKAQASRLDDRRFRRYDHEDAYHLGETPGRFLEQRGAFLGAVDPERVPYYLLLVGPPESLPFSFQFGLDLRYAVGRIAFDEAEAYYLYAKSVVDYEKASHETQDRRLALFGSRVEGDAITEHIADLLLDYLAKRLPDNNPGWRIESYVGELATASRLGRLLGGDLTPDLLFSGCHGLLDPDRPEEWTGAICCHDERAFGASDIPGTANPFGLITIFYGCHSAGLPLQEDFGAIRPVGSAGTTTATPRHQRPFVARLPKRLLGHPNGSALAVLAHVDRAYGFSYLGALSTHQPATFEDVLRRLMHGHPVGYAKELLDLRFAQLAAEMACLEDEAVRQPSSIQHHLVVETGLAMRDARNYVVLGDPAVRVGVGEGERA